MKDFGSICAAGRASAGNLFLVLARFIKIGSSGAGVLASEKLHFYLGDLRVLAIFRSLGSRLAET